MGIHGSDHEYIGGMYYLKTSYEIQVAAQMSRGSLPV